MKHLLLALSFLAISAASLSAADPVPAAKPAPVILLKLDDLGWQGRGPNDSVSERWKKVTAFLEDGGTKASYGIICESLADDRPGYIAWLKERQAKGLIEFWNHGYVGKFVPDEAAGKKGAFEGTTADEQREELMKGQRLAKEKLGIDMHAFGPHVCHTDATTYQVLAGIPEITMVWFYGPPPGATTAKFVFERKINIEVPLFVPNPDDVKARFEKTGKDLPYIALQGHPNQWDEKRFADFTKIVDYLKQQGCRFMQPSEYLATRPAAKP